MSIGWRDVIRAEDRAIYDAAGYGRRGRRDPSPALLVIDVTHGFVACERLPILESIARYPNSCGERGWEAMEQIARILERARVVSAPICYTAGITDHAVAHAGRWREKHPRTLEQPDDVQEIPGPIAPRDDLVSLGDRPGATAP